MLTNCRPDYEDHCSAFKPPQRPLTHDISNLATQNRPSANGSGNGAVNSSALLGLRFPGSSMGYDRVRIFFQYADQSVDPRPAVVLAFRIMKSIHAGVLYFIIFATGHSREVQTMSSGFRKFPFSSSFQERDVNNIVAQNKSV